MMEQFADLEKLFNNKSIKMTNRYFNQTVQDFDCIYLTQINYEKEMQKRKSSIKIITIDYYCDIRDKHNKDFFIFCFDKTIFIIDISEKIILKYFLSQYSDYTMYCVSKNAIQFVEQIKTEIQISYSNNKQKLFIDSQILNFLDNFNAESNKDNKTINKVKKCLAGYLIKKAYYKSTINRLNHSNDNNFQSHNKSNSIDKYIHLNDYYGTASVYLAYNIKKEQLFIIKIHKYSEEQDKLIKREMDNYETLKHQFCPRIYESIKSNELHYLIIEFINGKTLENFDFEKSQFSEYEIMNILFEIMIIIHYIHSLGYVYRDIKGNNIIIDEFKNAILIDFDRIINEIKYLEENEFTCDLNGKNLAPEIDDPKRFSNKVDIFSLGMLIKEKFMVSNITNEVMLKLNEMIEICLKENPSDRPNISQLIRYFYLNVLINYENNKEINEKLIHILENNFNIENIYDPEGFCTLGIIFQDGIYVEKNIKKSIEYFTKASDQNDLLAKTNLSSIYSDDKTFDKEKCLKYLTEAAEQDDPYAQYFLGICYYFSSKFDRNINKCIQYLTQSANNNYIWAQLTLGFVYYYIANDLQDVKKSISYLEIVINYNNNKQKKKNFYNIHGKYVLPNYDIILCYQMNNEKFSQIMSLFLLGAIYSAGKFINPNINKTLYYYSQLLNQELFNLQNFLVENNIIRKCLSQDDLKVIQNIINYANFFITNSSNLIGKIFMEGRYVPRDIHKAIEYFQINENNNNILSKCYLCFIYSNYYFDKIDIPKAKEIHHFLLKKSNDTLCDDVLNVSTLIKHNLSNNLQLLVDQFVSDFELMKSAIPRNIGDIYFDGIYTNRDIKLAIHYYKISADMSDPLACFILANFYLNGQYVKKDIKEAIRYYKVAATHDHTISQLYLGYIYYNGHYVKKNIINAIKYFYMASCNDNKNANLYLGIIFYTCKDYMRDMKLSIKYFRKASSFNDTYSKNNLGIIYKNGDGCERNISYSICYLNEAIKLDNNEISRFNLAHIYFYGKDVKQDLDKTIQLLISPPIKSFESGFNLLCLAIVPKCVYITINNIKNVINQLNPNCDSSIVSKIFNEINYKRLTNEYNYQLLYDKIEQEEYVITTINGTFTTRNLIEKDFQKHQNKNLISKQNNISKHFYEGFNV